MVVSSGENASGSVWWASSLDDVALRACLFDDKFVMHPNGEFDNDMGAETWLESFQVASEGAVPPWRLMTIQMMLLGTIMSKI